MKKSWDLVERTMNFAVDVFRLCRELPRNEEARDIVRQLRRSASSVAANYRAARRGGSKPHFVSKLGIVIEEADECGFWFDFLVRIELIQRGRVRLLAQEAHELVAIFTTSQKTAKARMRASRDARRAKGARPQGAAVTR